MLILYVSYLHPSLVKPQLFPISFWSNVCFPLSSRQKFHGFIKFSHKDKENFVEIAMKENPEIDIRKKIYNIKDDEENEEKETEEN